MSFARELTLVFALVACGCAVTAKKPPTPAARITSADLARVPKPPDDRFFLVLFGSQDRSRNPAYTHTWATLVRVRAADAGPADATTPGAVDPVLDVETISWLPAKLAIDAFKLRVEPGANVDLHATVRNSLDTNQEVAVWGPYEVWHGYAHRFRAQKEFLETGAIGYQCIDSVGEARRGTGCDCIHAVTDMDPLYPRWRYPLAFYGQPATRHLVRRLMHSPIFIDPPQTHDWLLPRLGLDAYPLDKRKYIGFSVPHVPGLATDLDVRALRLRRVALAAEEAAAQVSAGANAVPPAGAEREGP